MDRNTLMQIALSDPQISRAVDAMEAEITRMPVTPEEIAEAIQILEFVLSNPDKYQEVMAAAVRDGLIDADDLPPQFDAVYVMSLLVAFYSLEERMGAQPYAQGGLAVAARRVAAAGRGGDTMLAHINPREAAMLKAMGGSGTINPSTGLREYKGGFFKSLFKVVAPIALSFIAPGLGTKIGLALGAGATAAPFVGGAILGGLGSAITGGNPLQGAIMGGLGGGFGKALGASVAPGFSEAAQSAIGSGITGAVGSALTGGNPLVGGLAGAVGGYAGAGGFGSGISPAVATGIQTAGNAIASGMDPKTGLILGGLSGVAQGVLGQPRAGEPAPIESRMIPSQSPAEMVVNGMQRGIPGAGGTSPSLTGMQSGIPVPGASTSPMLTGVTPRPTFSAAGPTPADTGSLFGGLDASSALKGLAIASAANSLMSAPPDVQQAVTSLSPQQQEYFNRPSIRWDWNRMQRDANDMNMSLDQYMANYWPQITSGMYNMEVPSGQPMTGMARGGALMRLARGSGSGRADTINARLSDGEYVIDAETVALLGDGSTDEGARRLDKMRNQLRRHKGRDLAKGKFSADAKSPLAYLKGVA